MKPVVCCLVCVVLLAIGANGNDLRIFFGQPEYVPPTTAFVPEAHWGESAPPGTYMLGIWAEIDCHEIGPDLVMDVWNGIALGFTSVGAPVTVSDLTMDNFDHRIGMGTAYRWEADSDFGPRGDPDDFFLVAVNRLGLGGLWTPEWNSGSTDWWSYATGAPGEPGTRYRYWMGNVTLSCAGLAEVWFDIGAGGISRFGGSEDDRVYFGETETVPWSPFHPGSPDFVFTPEPAGLLLLCIGALAARRR